MLIDEKIEKNKQPILNASGDFYQALFNNILDGVFQTDLDGNYTLVNKPYAEFYGYDTEEMYGLNTSQTWASQEEKELVYKELKNRDIKKILKRFKRKDGSIGWLELSIRTMFDSKHKPIAYEGVAREVTERRIAEAAEKEATARAEFLIDLMVHDLNNLNQGMVLPLELIAKDPGLPLKHKKTIGIAIAQIERATELIRTVKRLQMVIEQPVSLTRKDLFIEVNKAADAARRVFPEKTLDLKIRLRGENFYLNADEFLSDLFFNLFHNSMKFDKCPTVMIEVKANAFNGNKRVVSVTDYGPGIPDSDKIRVLTRERGSKGSGMGLTLVKYLIERYDGTISIQDRVRGRPGEGIKILMTFPGE